MDWDASYDVVVVGSGAAGLSAALRASALGASAVVLEASEALGGSTAISGGVVWIPGNADMAARGVPDSREEALAYLTHLTRGEVPAERVAAYVDEAPRVLAWLERDTPLRLEALERYADYYPEAPGGKPGGRSMESRPFDATRLGPLFAHLRRPHPQSQVMGRFGISAREANDYLVPGLFGRLKLAWRLVQYLLRWRRRVGLARDTRLHAGNALVASLLRGALDRDLPLWRDCPVASLIVEDGVVTGVRATRDGAPIRVQARQGVVLAAGGFERNQAMRERYQRHPVDTAWNAGNLRNQGDGIRMGVEVGAAIERMDEAWWTPVTRIPRSDAAWVLVVEKSLPGSIFVNRHGRRFVNEAGPYLDVGRAMYDGDAVPDAFMIFDATYRHSYPVGPVAPGWAMPDRALSRRLREGFLVRADSLRELAARCDLDPDALEATVARFDAQARAGRDDDFGRGESLSDRYYSDPRVGPNPCLRAPSRPPFYAIRVYPGDLGTKGGLVTDAGGRVLDAKGQPIAGLYAAGNTTASVMGPTYPGAGGTIGPALVFGALAAESAAADVALRTPAARAVGGR